MQKKKYKDDLMQQPNQNVPSFNQFTLIFNLNFGKIVKGHFGCQTSNNWTRKNSTKSWHSFMILLHNSNSKTSSTVTDQSALRN